MARIIFHVSFSIGPASPPTGILPRSTGSRTCPRGSPSCLSVYLSVCPPHFTKGTQHTVPFQHQQQAIIIGGPSSSSSSVTFTKHIGT